jgi:NAD(P)-dependent dehydrogenase (short-subunit alcohol dehydrogenase family)
MYTKTILITGGTTGIGLATAQLLSAEGAKVIVTGRNPETLASAKKTLSGVVVLPSDSGDLAAAQALGDEIKTFAEHLAGTRGAILEQVPGIDARRQQRVTLQVRALPIRVRRNAHVANQHKRKTMNLRFPYGSALRQCFSHIFRRITDHSGYL